jgi:predicted RNA-binding protein YlqC (UPF0109 family)
MITFKNFLDDLIPVAEELADKPANVRIDAVPTNTKLSVQILTEFVDGKATRTVVIALPGQV